MPKKEIVQQTDKESFLAEFSDLRPDLSLPTDWSDEKKDAVLAELKPKSIRSSLLNNIPIVCRGPRCPFSEVCPLLEKGLAPIGKKCPLEQAAVQQFMADYCYELGVDPDNLVEFSMVRSLVDQEIQYLRKTKYLSTDSFIQENVMGVDKDGDPIMKKELHLAVEWEDKIHKRKKDLRNQLLATREARAKIGQSAIDTAQSIANIMDSIREVEDKKQKALEAKLGTLYKDTYIEEAEIVEDGD